MTSIWIILSNPNDIDHSFNPNQNLLSTFLVGSPKPLIPLAALPEITTEVTCDIQTWGLWHWKELQIKDVQTARAKGSSGGWGQLCTGKTFTVEKQFLHGTQRRLSPTYFRSDSGIPLDSKLQRNWRDREKGGD